MFDDLPADLGRLQTLRIWHAHWLRRIDSKISDVEQRAAEEERGRRRRPQPPDWLVQLGIGVGRPPLQLHAGHCVMISGIRYRPVDRDEARRLLDGGLDSCIHCNPAALLGILD